MKYVFFSFWIILFDISVLRFICVVVYITVPLFLIIDVYTAVSILSVVYPLTYALTLKCFPGFVIKNTAAVPIHIQIFMQTYALFSAE